MRRFGRWFSMLFLLVMVTGIFTVCAQAVSSTVGTNPGVSFWGSGSEEEEKTSESGSGSKETGSSVTALPQTGWDSGRSLPMAGAGLLLLVAGLWMARVRERNLCGGRPGAENRRKYLSLVCKLKFT